MQRFVASLITAASILATSQLVAANFERADQLFAQREDNLQIIAQARAAYKQELRNASAQEAVYAVQQLGKLAYYEGELLTSAEGNPSRRTEIFDDCRNFVEQIRNNAEAVTQYHYWKLLCTAFWVQSAPLLSRISQIGEIKRYFDSIIGQDLEVRPELGLDARYMYAGMLRVSAGIFRQDLSSLVRSGLPDREKALELADRALATEAHPSQEAGGDMYYSNHRGRAQVLIQLNRGDEAKSFLEQSIADAEALLAEQAMPADFSAEAKAELRIMKDLLRGL